MTTQQSIQAEIDNEKRRQSRIDSLLSTMPEHQAKRLNEAKQKFAVGLARAFGSRLNEHVAQRLIDGIVLDPACICTIGGGVSELPSDAKGWEAYAREQAKSEPLAQLSIDASDEILKETIRSETLENMSREQRIQKSRNGSLDEHLAAAVKAQIEARSGV